MAELLSCPRCSATARRRSRTPVTPGTPAAPGGSRLGACGSAGSRRRRSSPRSSRRGFPWDTWAGTLNLFVWLVVGGYLVWGCRARYALLGLAIMPLAAGLLLASWLAGAGSPSKGAAYSTPFLVFHVGLVLAAFAGLTLAAAMSASTSTRSGGSSDGGRRRCSGACRPS